MKMLLHFASFLTILVLVNGQRRITQSGSASSGGDDTLNVFGATRPRPDSGRPSDSGSNSGDDLSSFSVIDRAPSSGSSGSGGRRGSSDGGPRGGNRGDSGLDTGFDRLTTQRTTPSDHDDFGSNSGRSSGRVIPSSDHDFQPNSGNSNGDRDADTFGSSGSSGRFPSSRTTTPADRDFHPNPNNGDRDFSSGDHDADSFGSSGSSGRLTSFPENYRIEVEVQRLENKGSILATGSSCDILSACDTKLYAIISTDKPLSSWPGSIPVAKWPVIFAVTNVDSPTISKVVTRDVCLNSIDQASLRVRAVDADSISAEDEINRFDCTFSLTPSAVGRDPSAAQWGETMECKATSQVGKIKLFARQRAYQISSSSCNSQAF